MAGQSDIPGGGQPCRTVIVRTAMRSRYASAVGLLLTAFALFYIDTRYACM